MQETNPPLSSPHSCLQVPTANLDSHPARLLVCLLHPCPPLLSLLSCLWPSNRGCPLHLRWALRSALPVITLLGSSSVHASSPPEPKWVPPSQLKHHLPSHMPCPGCDSDSVPIERWDLRVLPGNLSGLMTMADVPLRDFM